jgi:hypothetical protein
VNERASDISARGQSDHAPRARALDVEELIGSWINTEPAPSSIARVSIEPRDGAPRILTSGADPGDRGDARADSLHAGSPSGREAVAFTAAYEGPGGEVGLHANVSKGLLIISSFRRHPAGAGRAGVFAREFFRRDQGSAGQDQRLPLASQGGGRPVESPLPGVAEPRAASILHGNWRNTQRAPALLGSLTFSAATDPLMLRADGLGARGVSDSPTFDAELLVDGPGACEPSKIRGRCRLGDRDVDLHGWVKQEVLVLAYFVRFPAGADRSNYFDREFFYRER